MAKKHLSVLVDEELLRQSATIAKRRLKMEWNLKTTDIITDALNYYVEKKGK